MLGTTTESLGREGMRSSEIQVMQGWNQGGQQDHVLLDCGSQPWLSSLRETLGPCGLGVRRLERVGSGKRQGLL